MAAGFFLCVFHFHFCPIFQLAIDCFITTGNNLLVFL